jgi:hypothetical protein
VNYYEERSIEKNQVGDVLFTVRGVLEAYGNEPHVVRFIRGEDGKLYYPAGALQKLISRLPAGIYEWTGILEPPQAALPGLIPEHDGVFATLEWKRLDDE